MIATLSIANLFKKDTSHGLHLFQMVSGKFRDFPKRLFKCLR